MLAQYYKDKKPEYISTDTNGIQQYHELFSINSPVFYAYYKDKDKRLYLDYFFNESLDKAQYVNLFCDKDTNIIAFKPAEKNASKTNKIFKNSWKPHIIIGNFIDKFDLKIDEKEPIPVIFVGDMFIGMFKVRSNEK